MTPGLDPRVRSDQDAAPKQDLVEEAEKQALLLSEPEVFFTTSAYDWSPLVMVRLEAIDITRLRELVTDAWHMRAPAGLEVQHPLVFGQGDR